MQVSSYTPHPLMSNGMCFAAQSVHEQGGEDLLSCCLLHMTWHFVSRPSFPCNIPASCIHYFHLASHTPHLHHLGHFFSPDPHGISHPFCYYLPLPDQTARFSSDRFNFSECRPSKTNILEHGYQNHSLMSKYPMPKKSQKTLYFHFPQLYFY